MENKLIPSSAVREPHAQAGVSRRIFDHKLISANAVRDLCGGVSDMTLWRWLADPDLGFPKPCYIGKRRYWREADMGEWLKARAEATA